MIIHWPQYNAFMVDDQETEGRRQRRWKGAKGATSSHPGPSGVNGLICDLVSIGSLRISFDDISFCRYRVIFKISLKYRYRIFFENITCSVTNSSSGPIL